MPFDGSRQNDAFDGPADPLQFADIIAVADALHVLLDDRAAVQHFRDVMGGCPDDFDAALISLGVRFASDKCREEGMVDINDPVPVMFDEGRRNDLHVPRQNDDIDIAADHFKLPLLGFFFVSGVTGM